MHCEIDHLVRICVKIGVILFWILTVAGILGAICEGLEEFADSWRKN